MTDERKVFEHIESATVLKPGDRVLLTVDWGHRDLEVLEEAKSKLAERFPGVEFTFVTDVESVTIMPGLVEENTDD